MLKKLLFTGGALALLSSVTLGVPLWSYARCGTNWLSETATDAVPLEWELKRARQMVADLKPEIHGNTKRIAEERIEVARLERELEATEERLAKSRSNIEQLMADLEEDSDSYSYGGRTYTSAQVKADLGNRFKRFKTRKETAEKLENMLSARQSSLRAAEEEMDTMLAARRQLEVEIENLNARLGALRVAQASSELNLDDSRLAHTRELLDNIASRIDVAEQTMAVDAEYFGEIPVDEPSDDELVDEIANYLEHKPDQPETESVAAIRLD